MGDAEAEARTEKGEGGAGSPAAHPTGADLAAATGGPVSGARASRGGEPNDAGYSPSHFTAAAQAAAVGGPVSAKAGAIDWDLTTDGRGGGKTPWSERKEATTANEAMVESPPPERSRAPNRGKGEEEPPPSSTRPRRAARARGAP